MGLDRAIEFGKEHRKKYRGAKAIDKTCRNHGSDDYSKSDRVYRNKKKEFEAQDKENEYEKDRSNTSRV